MKTIFHDYESGTKLEIEGTFANSKAQLLDDEGNILIESEGSYREILEVFNELSEGEDKKETEEAKQYEEHLTNSDFRGDRVKVLEGIQEGELFVVNNDEMEYYLEFDKGEIVKFLFDKDIGLPLMFRNSDGHEQALTFEDVTKLENQEGNSRKFDFCAKNNILFTENTNLKGTKVSLAEDSKCIEDDGSLIIHADCADGIPYIVSKNSGNGAFVELSGLKLRTEEDTPSLEVGDYVKVKEGKELFGAKGFAIVTNIEGDNIYLKGVDANSKYKETWINKANNVIKIG